jgi:hypothetical protein
MTGYPFSLTTLFTHVLNYLHTKEIHLTEAIGMRGLCMKLSSMESLHSQQLKLVQELEHSSCGNELYYGCLNLWNAKTLKTKKYGTPK